MDVIYLDSLFGLNLLIDYCLVLVSARVCGVVLHRWRYALAALIGALYAALMVLPGFGWLANGMMKLALGAAMALIAFGGEAHLCGARWCFSPCRLRSAARCTLRACSRAYRRAAARS